MRIEVYTRFCCNVEIHTSRAEVVDQGLLGLWDIGFKRKGEHLISNVDPSNVEHFLNRVCIAVAFFLFSVLR